MFDPTAFDNMKVVIEGALYDLDLAGEIVITDRNDIVNMAKMSRGFDVHFQLPEAKGNIISAKMEIKSDMINLAAELVPDLVSKRQSGCKLRLQFFHKDITDEKQLKEINWILTEIWGDTRKICQSVTITPSKSLISNCISIEFDRLIGEDQMNDLVELIDFMITTIQHLQAYLIEVSN
ncbi:hypothetical protein V7087_28870 [Neobacillus niacini]|uniref:hypothetical protein n=1 Tax=Neobacillus niacini TaxID=86668 RepID=UPI003000F0C6